MMIFDDFATLLDAVSFAQAAQEKTGEQYILCHDQETFDKHEVFPFELDFPVVLVPRLDDMEAEAEIEILVVEFNGEFAGT